MLRKMILGLLVVLVIPATAYAQEPTIVSVQDSLTRIDSIAAHVNIALIPAYLGIERVSLQLRLLTVQAALSDDPKVVAATLGLHRRYQALLEAGLQSMIDSRGTYAPPLPAERAPTEDSVSYDYVTALSTVLRIAYSAEGPPMAKGLVAYRLWRSDIRQLHTSVPSRAYAIELLTADLAYEGLLQMPIEETLDIKRLRVR